MATGGEPGPFEAHAGVAAIVARIPRSEATRAMADEFRARIAAFERLPATSQADVSEGLERNLRRWWRWLSTGETPAERDFEPLRDWARARAADGVGLEDLLRAFGLARRLGWELIRRHARPEEAALLLDAAGLLMQYADRVSAIVTETYLAERELLVSEDERSTRTLLERLSSGAPLTAADLALAERLDAPVEDAYAPFAIVMPGLPARRHAALAARLRQRGWRLTLAEGERVVGLASRPLEIADLGERDDVLLAIGDPAPRAELAAARAELLLVLDHGRRAGARGTLRAEDHLLEIMAGASPRAAARLWARVIGPLLGSEREELLHTLRALVACDLDRAAASAALHIHRNTLTYRLARIEERTGLDLTSLRGLASVYLATLVDTGRGPRQARS